MEKKTVEITVYTYDEFKEKVIELLVNYPGTTATRDGEVEYEILADYRDRLSDKDIIKICESEDPEQEFCEMIDNLYTDLESEIFGEIQWYIEDSLEEEFDRFLTDEENDWLYECLRYTLYFTVPSEHFLKQEVNTVIVVDTGDGNYDFTLNCRYPAYNGKSEGEIDRKASIRWLAETQGYSELQLREELEKGDMDCPETFMDSLRVELANGGSHMLALTILAKMTLDDLIRLNQRMKRLYIDGHRAYDTSTLPNTEGCIRISKKAEVGLYDSWSGAGGPFEIMLEKDFELPVKYIHSATPDGGEGRYSLQESYGLCTSVYRNVVSGI